MSLVGGKRALSITFRSVAGVARPYASRCFLRHRSFAPPASSCRLLMRVQVSGYDVSAVSGEEVVELSSWEAESTTPVGGGASEARRRRPLR